MMTREMMEEIFETVCEEHDCAWYEVFDGDLMEEVNERIMAITGWTEEEMEDDDTYCEWASCMAMDL